MTPLLEVAGATVRFGAAEVLRDVFLDVEAGTAVGLVGPNGAGKSTLLDAISGLVPMARGSVRFGGGDVSGLAPHRRARAGLSRTFQSLDLFEDLTVGENLQVAGGEAASDPDHTRLPVSLSAGRRKEVALARALAGGPRVLLLDEPAAGLDDAGRAALAARLRELVGAGMGVLLADHDLDLVLRVCQQVTVLDFGSVIASGPPEAVRVDPAVAAAYLGGTAGVPTRTSAPGGDLILDAQGVVAGYGAAAPVLQGVDLAVRAGEVVAFLGANGAGKTTTLRVLSGILPRQNGQITVIGAAMPARPRPDRLARRGLAHVPQDRAVLPNLTVAENLRLASRDPAAIQSALDRFPALVPLRARRAGRLSGGEQQLVAIARALAARPRLLLVDELSMGLAPRAARQVRDAVQELATTGAGVVLAEQHPRLALEIAHRAVVLVRGRVGFDGAAADLAADAAILQAAYLGRTLGSGTSRQELPDLPTP